MLPVLENTFFSERLNLEVNKYVPLFRIVQWLTRQSWSGLVQRINCAHIGLFFLTGYKGMEKKWLRFKNKVAVRLLAEDTLPAGRYNVVRDGIHKPLRIWMKEDFFVLNSVDRYIVHNWEYQIPKGMVSKNWLTS